MIGKNQSPDIGKNTQFPHNDPTKGGRPSLDKELMKLLEEQEEIPNAMIHKLVKLTDNKNPSVALKAIQMLFERVDGKALQKVIQENTHKIKDYSSWSDRWLNTDSAESKT